MNLGAKQLHQNDAHDGHRHGDGADDLDAKFLLRDQGQDRQRPDEAQEHFVDAGEGRVSRLIPAMRDRAGVGGEAGPGCDRGKAHVGICAGYTKSKVESTGPGVEDQRCIEQV